MKRDKNSFGLKKQLERLQDFITEAGINVEKRQLYINNPLCDFTRNRKLSFLITVNLIVGLLKKVSTLN